MDKNARQPNESFEDYKARRVADHIKYKAQRRGTLIWDSSVKGTYIKAKHGDI